MLKSHKSESKYKIPNCTPNQLMRFLEALKDGAANQNLINVLVGDKDAHHQRNMAIKFGLVRKSDNKYILTDFGKHIVLLYGSYEFTTIYREECIPRVPIFRDMLRVIKLAKQMKKDDFKEKIKDLVGSDLDWSPVTLNQYTNLVIGYLKLGGVIEYQRNQELIKYIL